MFERLCVEGLDYRLVTGLRITENVVGVEVGVTVTGGPSMTTRLLRTPRVNDSNTNFYKVSSGFSVTVGFCLQIIGR